MEDPRLIPQAARVFKALAEPLRLRILYELKQAPCNVNALAEKVGAKQANVSRHLRVLADCGLVRRRKEGLFTIYEIRGSLAIQLCNIVCAGIVEDARELVG
jgi:DNA-binding transcriptional ArsR family regulator